MASAGINRTTGRALADFAHVQQSINVILTTPIGSRVMRREFGSELFDLIDRPMTDQVILAIYSAVVVAIARWEPRFRVTSCGIINLDVAGLFEMELGGTYYPRGHRGDFTGAEENQRFSVRLSRAA